MHTNVHVYFQRRMRILQVSHSGAHNLKVLSYELVAINL